MDEGHEETLKEGLREQSTHTLPPHYTVSPPFFFFFFSFKCFVLCCRLELFVVMDVRKKKKSGA